ncbi:MAG: glycosyltransferase [Chitinophagales bacterium]|nr:glycosyltransferase [Chitinophagales bacterium]MCB9020647.1 glycosyltransferase [Chitinophagales bacterium]
MATRKKVLLLTIHLPFPINHGASLFNTYKLATWLHQHHDLYFACFLKGEDKKYKDAFLADTGITRYHMEELNVERNAVNLLKSYLLGVSINMFRNRSASFRNKIEEVSKDMDVIVVDHYEAMQYVPADFRGKVVFRTHNAEYLIWSRYAEVEPNPIKKMVIRQEARRIKKWELRYVKRADLVLGAPNDNENHEPDPVKRNKKFIEFLHLGQDEQIVLPVPDFTRTELALVYVGTLTWEANIDGLLWLVDGGWEKLKGQFPELKFYIIGKNADQRLMDMAARHRDIILTGFVEDLEDYLPRCRVNVIPLRFGSGMKVKTINGLCRGIPMVSTSIGTEGLRVEDGKDVFIADDLDTFIDRTALLLTDQQRWEELANNSKETAKAHYTWDSLYRILAENI